MPLLQPQYTMLLQHFLPWPALPPAAQKCSVVWPRRFEGGHSLSSPLCEMLGEPGFCSFSKFVDLLKAIPKMDRTSREQYQTYENQQDTKTPKPSLCSHCINLTCQFLECRVRRSWLVALLEPDTAEIDLDPLDALMARQCPSCTQFVEFTALTFGA